MKTITATTDCPRGDTVRAKFTVLGDTRTVKRPAPMTFVEGRAVRPSALFAEVTETYDNLIACERLPVASVAARTTYWSNVANGLPNPPAPRTQSKLTIMLRLDAMGKWANFKAVLATLPEIVQDAWLLAQDIREDNPLFVANKPALLAAITMTDAQLSSLFDA